MEAIETIYTDRLVARRPSLDDFDDLSRMHSDPEVMKTLGGLRTNEETLRYLQEKIDHWETYGFGFWIVRNRVDGTFVGRGGLQHIEIAGGREIELGYGVLRVHWNNGFATEMARAMVAVAFEELTLENVVCFALKHNLASLRVMEKAGYQYERDFLHEGEPHALSRMTGEYYRDHVHDGTDTYRLSLA